MLDVRGSQNLAILRWLRTRMSSKPWLLCSPKNHSGKFPYFHDRCLSYSNLCGCQKIGPSLGCDRFICHGSHFAKGVNPPLLRTKRRVILLPQRPTTGLMPLVPRNSRAANLENEERDTKPSWPDSFWTHKKCGPTVDTYEIPRQMQQAGHSMSSSSDKVSDPRIPYLIIIFPAKSCHFGVSPILVQTQISYWPKNSNYVPLG